MPAADSLGDDHVGHHAGDCDVGGAQLDALQLADAGGHCSVGAAAGTHHPGHRAVFAVIDPRAATGRLRADVAWLVGLTIRIDHLAGNPQTIYCGREAAIGHTMKQYFSDLFLTAPVIERTTNVRLQLMG